MPLEQRIHKNPAILHLKSFLAAPLQYVESRWHFARSLGLTRWAKPESLDDDWDERTALIAGMVQPDSSVLEFGAGKERLRAFLPQGCSYQPSDIVARSADTLVCDLNDKALPVLDRKYDYIVFSGVLEYVHDLQKLLHYVRANCQTCILSYAPTDRLECMITRMRSGWVNHLSQASFESMLENAGFTIEAKRVWREQDVYSLR